MIVIATPVDDGVPAGYIEASVAAIPAAAATVTVSRKQQRRTFLTRGLVNVPSIDDVYARDFEAPFETPVQYVAVARAADGTIVSTATSATVTLSANHASSVTIHDPIRPLRTVTLRLGVGATSGGRRSMRGDVIEIDGSSVPIVMHRGRGGYDGLSLSVVSYTVDQARLLEELLGGYDDDTSSGVLCFRPSANVPSEIPRTFFGRVESPLPQWWPGGDGNGNPRADWQLTATEVQPPFPGVVEPIITWADWTAWMKITDGDGRSGWAKFNAAFASYRDANRSLVARGLGS